MEQRCPWSSDVFSGQCEYLFRITYPHHHNQQDHLNVDAEYSPEQGSENQGSQKEKTLATFASEIQRLSKQWSPFSPSLSTGRAPARQSLRHHYAQPPHPRRALRSSAPPRHCPSHSIFLLSTLPREGTNCRSFTTASFTEKKKNVHM